MLGILFSKTTSAIRPNIIFFTFTCYKSNLELEIHKKNKKSGKLKFHYFTLVKSSKHALLGF